jgi:hypothetical protein
LKNSPFGKEPFDGLFETGSGSFQDNYDGYIFLGSLDTEPNGELLPDLYNDKFIKELERREGFYGTTLKEDLNLEEATTKGFIDMLLKEHKNRRWDYLPQLKEGLVNSEQLPVNR